VDALNEREASLDADLDLKIQELLELLKRNMERKKIDNLIKELSD